MSGNTFGHLLRLTSFGESHGPAIGGVLDGMPPGIALSEADIQPALDRRRPGTSRHTTQRREPDTVRLLSGVYQGETTGTPIGFVIDNTDQRSKDYDRIARQYRPGHADLTYIAKYGRRDPRGGGRASARETAVRVAAGAMALKVLTHLLGPDVAVRGALVALGGRAVDPARWDWNAVADNPFFCPDPETAALWAEDLDKVRKAGSSVGAVAQVEAHGLPAGLGAPVFDRLDADLAKALMSINAVKGVEIGAGFAAAAFSGEENADEMRPDGAGGIAFQSNNAGGILGGISSGQPIVARAAFKPTSSILTPRRSVDQDGNAVEVVTTGRHDPCVGIRGVPVAEAMMTLTLADHLLRQRAIAPG
ncbi:chorismate synthase [Roseospirillum parvum]|uniref:Chorismate synthase n=1 Tax=Roseospirillum parvum TaxID=83401 RepID=A0A1G8FN79_9PROT|nr:chorismate synthase [Roseospirillum parvum]SDH83531.1 chorismate synthase [Roseospirillum parvum]